MSDLKTYSDQVATDFLEDITDHVFHNIQHNEKLMREYQTQVHRHSLLSVNTAIGKSVKDIFGLENASESNSPRSWLIKSYMQHSLSKPSDIK